jgi:diguanylate cyclase (GGDEF)-like protein
MPETLDTTIFDEKPRFLSIFLVTTLIGILFISLAVYRASRELEIIHEVDSMHRLIYSMLGEERIGLLINGNHSKWKESSISDHHFYILSDNQIQLLHTDVQDNTIPLRFTDIESTRVNQRGGYIEMDDGRILTWVNFKVNDNRNQNQLLVVHTFKSAGLDALSYVYKKRIIVPAFFYLWLMVWVSLIFNHLLKKVKSQQKQMRHMALHDALTGLPNRNLMEDRLLKLIKLGRRDNKKFALSLIDMDEFKAINDNNGHRYGDELLRQVARRLESVLRDSDTAARLGGDEFTLILDDIDEHAWHAAFMRVQTALVEPYTLFDKTITMSISIGVAIYPVHGKDAETLLHNADEAMYTAKAEGGGMRIVETKDNLVQSYH